MARSSSPRQRATGYQPSAQRHLYIEPDHRRKRLLQRFNARLGDELLNGEVFYSLKRLRSWPRTSGNTTTQSDHAAPFYTEIQTAGAGELRHDGPVTVNALTMRISHFVGYDHKSSRLEEIQKIISKRSACVTVIR